MALYFVLRWLVAGLAGLAVAAVFQWWGDTIAKAAHEGPFGWLDRLSGGLIGAAMGVAIAAVVILLLLQPSLFAATAGVAGRAAYARPMVRAGLAVTSSASRLPGGAWLHGRFAAADGRLGGRRPPAEAKPAR